MVKVGNLMIGAALLLVIGFLLFVSNNVGHPMRMTGGWIMGIGALLFVGDYGYQVFGEGRPAFSLDAY